MVFREQRTIKAIGELRGAYPYAASLLSYVVIERVLKRYVLEHWTDSSLSTRTIPKKVKRHGMKTLAQLEHLPEKQRLQEVLCEMTLGDVESLLRRPGRERSAADRNEAVHSNLYLKEESSLPRRKQRSKNRSRFEKALVHLARALREYQGLAIVETKRGLAAQPN